MKKHVLIFLLSLVLALFFVNTFQAQSTPTITSFTPLSGAVGATVTITGTNFNTTPANNVVFFGATSATVSAATATSITATVPTGATYAHITVLNTATTLAAYSLANFNPTFTPNAGHITTADIAAKVDFTTGTKPYSVAIGDIDGDGKSDLAVANRDSNTVSVFRNTSASGSISSSSFAAKVDFTTGTNPFSVAIGDIDGDGKPDLAVANFSSNTVSVLRNTGSSGSIGFATKVDFTTGTIPYSVAIGDIDGDGKPDLAVANASSATVSVLRNTGSSGSISFAAKVDFTTGSSPKSVAMGDINGDGRPDLVVANNGSNTVSVLRNTGASGSISFAPKVDLTTGTNPYSVAIGDIDGDGTPDLAVANDGSATVSVLRNTGSSGSISFVAKVDFTTGGNPRSVAIGDINGDGRPDLSVANAGTATVSVLRNTGSSGSISFAAKVDFTTGSFPSSVAIGDIDGDGKPDLAVANSSANTISMLQNVPDATPPTLSTLAPLDNATGVTISSNFVLTFNENVQKGTGNILIKDASDDSTVQTIDVTTSAVSITNAVATINPATDLLKSKNYYIQISNTAFKDMTTNAYAGILDKTSYSFATELKVVPTINFVNFSKTYGDVNFDLGATSNSTGTISYSIVTGGTGSATLSGTNNKTVTLGNTGTVTIRATQASDANYNAATKDVTLTITKATLTVTADAKTKVYGSANPTLTLTYSGFVNSDTASALTTAPTVASTAVTTGTGVGTYTGDLVASGGASSNYTFSYVNGDFTITKATLTVTADAKTKVYGSANPTLTFTYSGFVNSDTASALTTAPTVASTAVTTGTGVGTYTGDLVASGGASSNYTFSYVNGDFTITKATLTVTADAKSKIYGASDPTLTYQLTAGSLVGTDAITGALTRATGETVGTYAISQNTLTAGSNYTITYISADLTINAAAVVATTQTATSVTTTGAVLNGTINEGGATATTFFEWGLASDLTGATITAATPTSVTAGAGTTAVSLTLTSLTDKTLYYYRIKGTNSTGTVNGTIKNFTTLDGTPPSVSSTVPANNATGITSSNLQMTFNENVQKGTGNILIKKISDNSVVATIDVTSTEVSISNAVVSLNLSPILTLPSNTNLYVQIPNTAFTDMASNAYAGFVDTTSWHFTTATVLGIDKNIIKGFAMYPNPVKDALNINAQEVIKRIQVFNLLGQQVAQKRVNSTKTSINLSRLPQGSYFVNITTDKTIKSVKLMKE